MSGAPLTEQVALRVGLAARELPDVDASLLLKILLQAVGAPLTATKLAKLRKARLRAAANGLLDQASEQQLSQAVNCLKGRGFELEAEPLPEITPYADGDMPGSIRIACTSNSGERIDGHFGSCAHFLVYQVSASDLRLIDIRGVPEVDPEEDKNRLRAELIADCHVLCTTSIGGPATAKVVRAGLHPMKLNEPRPAPELMVELQAVLSGSPPPWLAKIMGETPRERVRYAVEA
ncbi:dinitrogenase iron-molybdenum cofactor N-terminal domain-containing protein [Haliea sp. E17]|uniref:dinitrogenase iron-molybdenum cofactor N-terminal domain-containing protein n=1 Tax=Haliea sp. E17 TaxID=3401576 RepID=UPI003AB0E812